MRWLSVRADDLNETCALVRLEGALTGHFAVIRAFLRYIVRVECDVSQGRIAAVVPVGFIIDGNGARVHILHVEGQTVAQMKVVRKTLGPPRREGG